LKWYLKANTLTFPWKKVSHDQVKAGFGCWNRIVFGVLEPLWKDSDNFQKTCSKMAGWPIQKAALISNAV
jgi:hypothetical protein